MRFPDSSRCLIRRGKFCLFWPLFGASIFIWESIALSDPAPSAKIDPRVWEDTSDGGTGSFLVLLSEQAETRAITEAKPERKARRHMVVTALREIAERSQPAVRAMLEAHGASYRAYWIANLVSVEGKRGLVEALSRRADVKTIESNRAFRVPLEQPQTTAATVAAPAQEAATSVSPGLVQIKAPDLWALGITGQNVVYANADTGVQWSHPALRPHYRGWDGTNADHNYNWWDAIHHDISGNGSNPYGFSSVIPIDDHGHGTHTMGIGVGDDGAGNQIGVAPGARWIACRNMDEGVGRPDTYIECMQFFLAPTDLEGHNPDPDRAPDCVGNSWGCPQTEECAPNSLHAALESVRAAGIFMAVSAGNDGPNCSTIKDPPGLDVASITVGAVTTSDQIAYFSSRGPVTIDGSNRRKPDLVAPGVSVRSSYLSGSYRFFDGTSMASPHVSGAVALLWSAFPPIRGHIDYTEAILEQTAVPLFTTQHCGGDSATQIPNNVFGFGRIDLLAAYQSLTNRLASPELRIARLEQVLVFSWPTNSSPCVLESTENLPALPDQWSVVTNIHSLMGLDYVVTNDIAGPAKFFRLRCPVP